MTDETYAALVGALAGAIAGGLITVFSTWFLQGRERKARTASLHKALLGEIELAHDHLTQRVVDIKTWMHSLEQTGNPQMLPVPRTSTVIYDTHIAEVAHELDASDRRGLHEVYERIHVVNSTLVLLQQPSTGLAHYFNFMGGLQHARDQAQATVALLAHILENNGRHPRTPAPGTPPKPPAP